MTSGGAGTRPLSIVKSIARYLFAVAMVSMSWESDRSGLVPYSTFEKSVERQLVDAIDRIGGLEMEVHARSEAYAALERERDASQERVRTLESTIRNFSEMMSTFGRSGVVVTNDFFEDVSAVINARTSGPVLQFTHEPWLLNPVGQYVNGCTVFIDIVPTQPTTHRVELARTLGIYYLFRRQYLWMGQVVDTHDELDTLYVVAAEDGDGGVGGWTGWHGALTLENLLEPRSDFSSFLEAWCLFD